MSETGKQNETIGLQARVRKLRPDDFPHPPGKGGPPSTIENVDYLLSTVGITARFNSVKKRTELTSAEGSVSMTEVISLCLLNGMTTGHVADFVGLIAEKNAYNPVRDWICSVEWDGKDRLQALYDTILEADEYPRELKEVLIKRWLLSAVRAALAEGEFKCRGVLTLQGPQGIGKTTWFHSLVTDARLREECVLLDHHMDGSNKDSIINAITHWMIEIGELDSSFKKVVARLKGFLTNNCDKLRRPYGKEVVEYPRRSVFAASVNEEHFLVDTTGNSRWWTISVRGIRYDHGIDMQQVFAQLAKELGKGEKWWLTSAEDKQLAAYNARHVSVSVVRERILDIMDEEPNEHAPYRTAIEVLNEAGIDKPTNAHCREAGSILRDLVGQPKRVQGRDRWRFPAKTDNRY